MVATEVVVVDVVASVLVAVRPVQGQEEEGAATPGLHPYHTEASALVGEMPTISVEVAVNR